MRSATRRMSSAIHAPCVHDVMTGVTRIAPSVRLMLKIHCNAAHFPNSAAYELLQEIAKTLWCTGLFLLFRYCRSNLAMGQAGGDFVADIQAPRVLQQLALRVEDQRVSALKNGQRR